MRLIRVKPETIQKLDKMRVGDGLSTFNNLFRLLFKLPLGPKKRKSNPNSLSFNIDDEVAAIFDTYRHLPTETVDDTVRKIFKI